MRNDGTFQPGKFDSETSDSATKLTIYGTRMEDSAVYMCALRDAQCNADISHCNKTTL